MHRYCRDRRVGFSPRAFYSDSSFNRDPEGIRAFGASPSVTNDRRGARVRMVRAPLFRADARTGSHRPLPACPAGEGDSVAKFRTRMRHPNLVHLPYKLAGIL